MGKEPQGKLNLLFLIVIGLFFLSGLSSLIYQVIWTRSLSLVFGSTSLATATVLSVFMGGLGLGAYVAGRYCSRLKNSLLAYAVLEAFVGLWAIGTPFLFEAAIPLYQWVWQSFQLSPIPFGLFRFTVAALILIPPTTAMGATLPILARFVVSSLGRIGERVGILYSVNTLGAFCGAALGGFLLLPTFGLIQSNLIAALINFCLLLAVIFVQKTQGNTGEYLEQLEEPGNIESLPVNRAGLKEDLLLILIAFSLSGATAMVYEVAWTKALQMIIGSSVYAFSVMLCAFLLGIVSGSYVFARFVDKLRSPLLWFGLAQAMLGLLAGLALVSYNFLPLANLLAGQLAASSEVATILVRLLLAASILSPLTFVLGATFPLAVKVYAQDAEYVGRSVGELYAVNTLGAIIGSFLAGFVLLPLLGEEKVILVAALLNALLAMACIFRYQKNETSAATKAAKAFCLFSTILVTSLLCLPSVWDRVQLLYAQPGRRVLAGGRDTQGPVEILQSYFNLVSGKNVIFWKQGLSSSVAVVRQSNTGSLSLFTNGHIDASDGKGDLPQMICLAAYPLLIHSRAEDVAIIGWGCGLTAGTALAFPLEKLTAIELEPAVVEGARLFDPLTGSPDKDSRLDLVFNDGRNFMLCTPKKYDIIISEPSNPWQAGVCNLYTREYFALCKQRLKDEGILSLWMQSAEVPPESFQKVMAAVAAEFSQCMMLESSPGNMVILASNQDLCFHPVSLKQSLAEPKVSRFMRMIGLDSPDQVLSKVVLDSASFARLYRGRATNNDDFNDLEFSVARSYENRLFRKENRQKMDLAQAAPWRTVCSGALSAVQAFAVAQVCQLRGDMGQALSWAQAAINLGPNSSAALMLAENSLRSGNLNEALAFWLRADRQYGKESAPELNLVRLLMTQNDYAAAIAKLEKVLKADPANKMAKLLYARIIGPRYFALFSSCLDGAEFSEGRAKDILRRLEPLALDRHFLSQNEDGLFLLAEAELKLKRYAQAKDYIQRYIVTRPKSGAALRFLGSILYLEGDREGAARFWMASFKSSEPAVDNLMAQAALALRDGNEAQCFKNLRLGLEMNPSDQQGRLILAKLSARLPAAAALREKIEIMNSLFSN